jgi:hypothetical protein
MGGVPPNSLAGPDPFYLELLFIVVTRKSANKTRLLGILRSEAPVLPPLVKKDGDLDASSPLPPGSAGHTWGWVRYF